MQLHARARHGNFGSLPMPSSHFFSIFSAKLLPCKVFEPIWKPGAVVGNWCNWVIFRLFQIIYNLCNSYISCTGFNMINTCLNAQNVFESIWKAISVCLVRGFFCHNVQGRLLPSLECRNYRGTIYDRMQRDITRWWCQARTMQWLNMQKVRVRLEPND